MVVGWYKYATGFRYYQEAVFAPEDIQYYLTRLEKQIDEYTGEN